MFGDEGHFLFDGLLRADRPQVILSLPRPHDKTDDVAREGGEVRDGRHGLFSVVFVRKHLARGFKKMFVTPAEAQHLVHRGVHAHDAHELHVGKVIHDGGLPHPLQEAFDLLERRRPQVHEPAHGLPDLLLPEMLARVGDPAAQETADPVFVLQRVAPFLEVFLGELPEAFIPEPLFKVPDDVTFFQPHAPGHFDGQLVGPVGNGCHNLPQLLQAQAPAFQFLHVKTVHEDQKHQGPLAGDPADKQLVGGLERRARAGQGHQLLPDLHGPRHEIEGHAHKLDRVLAQLPSPGHEPAVLFDDIPYLFASSVRADPGVEALRPCLKLVREVLPQCPQIGGQFVERHGL